MEYLKVTKWKFLKTQTDKETWQTQSMNLEPIV
jgi:hypothetical protein